MSNLFPPLEFSDGIKKTHSCSLTRNINASKHSPFNTEKNEHIHNLFASPQTEDTFWHAQFLFLIFLKGACTGAHILNIKSS